MQPSPCKPLPAAAQAPPKPKRPVVSIRKFSPESQSREARQIAAAILEVLAGARTPTDAASALEVSLPRYYALEARALQGFLKACERRPRGPRLSPDREISRLRRELERLQRELARNQALLRSAQRAVGLRAAEQIAPKRDLSGKKKRRRKPVARALRAAAILKAPPEGLEPAAVPKHTVGGQKA